MGFFKIKYWYLLLFKQKQKKKLKRSLTRTTNAKVSF